MVEFVGEELLLRKEKNAVRGLTCEDKRITKGAIWSIYSLQSPIVLNSNKTFI